MLFICRNASFTRHLVAGKFVNIFLIYHIIACVAGPDSLRNGNARVLVMFGVLSRQLLGLDIFH